MDGYQHVRKLTHKIISHSISISSNSVKLLFALIRSSLWQTPIKCLPANTISIDWDEIGKLSMQQTVGSSVLNGALRLPQELRPSKDWILKAYTFIERNKRSHLLLDKTVAEATTKLSEIGIRPILLKGQAYARAYPMTTLRQCGDIDLYVGEENYRKAYEATKLFGWESEEEFNPKAKHYGCSLNGVRIELHRVASQLPLSSDDKRFQEWSRRQLMSGRTMNIAGTEIGVPTPIFDAIFVFIHMYLHFINGGIGLRQVSDWILLLHEHNKNIDLAELEKLLIAFHLMRPWILFSSIAVRYLGLPENECPFYSPKHSKEADRLLYFILKEGNFGRANCNKSKRPKGYFAGKIYSLSRNSKMKLSKLSIDPRIILRYYFSYVLKGVARVLKDIHKGDF